MDSWLLFCRSNGQVLSDRDCESIYELVFSSHRAVAQAAGEFLNCRLFSQEATEEQRNARSRQGKQRSENTHRVRDLVQFFIESEVSYTPDTCDKSVVVHVYCGRTAIVTSCVIAASRAWRVLGGQLVGRQ